MTDLTITTKVPAYLIAQMADDADVHYAAKQLFAKQMELGISKALDEYRTKRDSDQCADDCHVCTAHTMIDAANEHARKLSAA